MHLHVGDIPRADAFYREALGFDVMTRRYPRALFLGAGGYHHHVGTNTWAGPQAHAPAEDDAQLLAWTLELPTSSDVEALTARLASVGHQITRDEGDAPGVRDPWGTRVEMRASQPG